MKVIERKTCNNCQSLGGDTANDNQVVYEDYSSYCFACGWVVSNKDNKTTNYIEKDMLEKTDKIDLSDRGISKAVAEKYGVFSTIQNGKSLNVFPVFDTSGKQVKQKIKEIGNKKYQTQLGDTKTNTLFGQHIFNPSQNIPIIITEGEEDALAAHDMLGYPAVTSIKGANSLREAITENLEWLSGFKHVVLCFDNDDPGIKATSECVELFEPGKVRVATLPLKDANDMLLAGRQEEFKKCIWNASISKPDTIVFPSDVVDKVLERPKVGLPWPWPSLTQVTYGHRFGETYLIYGATGIGKTEVTDELIFSQIDAGVHCGIFSFEQYPEERIRRMVSKKLNKRIYQPGCADWDVDEIRSTVEWLNDKVALYNPVSGVLSIDKILINIRYLNKLSGTRFFILDNLKAMATNPYIDGKIVPDYQYVSYVTNKLTLLARELKITIIIINHVRKNDINISAKVSSYDMQNGWNAADAINQEGFSWESGRVPTIADSFGGGSVCDLVDYVIALSRNTISDNPLTKRTLCFTILKSGKFNSKYTGFKFNTYYDDSTGRLIEGERNNG